MNNKIEKIKNEVFSKYSKFPDFVGTGLTTENGEQIILVYWERKNALGIDSENRYKNIKLKHLVVGKLKQQ